MQSLDLDQTQTCLLCGAPLKHRDARCAKCANKEARFNFIHRLGAAIISIAAGLFLSLPFSWDWAAILVACASGSLIHNTIVYNVALLTPERELGAIWISVMPALLGVLAGLATSVWIITPQMPIEIAPSIMVAIGMKEALQNRKRP